MNSDPVIFCEVYAILELSNKYSLYRDLSLFILKCYPKYENWLLSLTKDQWERSAKNHYYIMVSKCETFVYEITHIPVIVVKTLHIPSSYIS